MLRVYDMKTFFRSFMAAAIGLSLLALPVSADTSKERDKLERDTIIVTATLGTETVYETLSSVTVISAETLKRQQVRELSQVLRGQPGVNVITNGSFGKNTSVFTRGTGSESTVLLVDGIRIRSATSGGASWQYIPAQLINRLEIVRGPRGTLYGADAVGGVVQAFTMPLNGDNNYWLQAGGGSLSTRQLGGGVSGRSGNTRYSLQGNHFDTDGTRLREGGQDRGFQNNAATASVQQGFDNGASIGVLAMHSRGENEFEGGETDFVMQVLGLRAQMPITDYLSSSLKISEARDEQDNEDTFGASTFNTRSRSVRWENAFSLGLHELVAGAEYLLDEVDGTTNYDEESRDNKAVFAQLISEYHWGQVQLSARWDDNEAFGSKTTGAAALGFDIDSSHSVRVSYSSAFRAPTFNDLYFPGFGNANLDAETAYTAELGLRGNYRNAFWDAAIYQTDIDDLIQFDAATFSPQNVATARIRGVELGAGINLNNLGLRFAATVQDPRDRDTDNRLVRRSKQSARVDADYDLFEQVSVGMSVVGEGNRFNDAANQTKLSGYATLDFRLGVQLTDKLSARLSVDNALDKAYTTARRGGSDPFDFLAAGRTAFFSLRYETR